MCKELMHEEQEIHTIVRRSRFRSKNMSAREARPPEEKASKAPPSTFACTNLLADASCSHATRKGRCAGLTLTVVHFLIAYRRHACSRSYFASPISIGSRHKHAQSQAHAILRR
eukprot:4243418-Pleurochrysis_carterae.AAC.2